ncbi:ribose-phosphate pyrophosphokinase [Vibrio phage eugene 12A10]|uniref:ribose-phosphate pyrophosphokinase n=1 Tax=Vibrio phage eugene 12A10 TaxID=573172 RepID=UPI000351E22C|nr:ribose-phosphate pyrophosphokinase [Vibrio phage eugene 12A10]AGN51602.1 hypothetical protein VPLG_00163 [Vibrio phage eugene 12A10]
MITVFSNNQEVQVNRLQFSDGALTFKLEDMPKGARYISIKVCPTTPVYFIREELLLITECIWELVQEDHFGRNVPMYLELPYLPYARADRKFEHGNPVPLHSFLNTLDHINGFDEIYICDIHNKSAVEGFNLNIIEKTQLECFKASLPQDFDTKYDLVLAPDKGSVEKAKSIANHLEIPVYNCGKERDASTGKILRSTLPDGVDFTGKTVLIPDDLCDGGYTFIKLAEQVKAVGAEQVDLYVTHLIASKGLDVFEGLVDNVYCHHTVGNYVNKLDVTHFNNSK